MVNKIQKGKKTDQPLVAEERSLGNRREQVEQELEQFVLLSGEVEAGLLLISLKKSMPKRSIKKCIGQLCVLFGQSWQKKIK